jgi:CheY-like chemotaxis protein
MLLEMAGHHVYLAHDGPEALDAANTCEPQLVFLDIGLPKLDGYEVAIRLAARRPAIMLVAMTGYGQSTDRERAHQSGFAHHLVKPADFERIEQILQEAAHRANLLP